ncbi:hypothetical protein [Microbacterium maritypicum]|uniref:hypothetical protein n=1 Tax=Microbacterium maritypicum TaxID=33918 RepID=UPI00382E4106
MRLMTDTWYVFGQTWWPFDGAVTAAIIAFIGTVTAIVFNGRRFTKAETNQNTRHVETLDSTKLLGGREQLLIDLRRAEDALAGNDKHQWIYAGVILQQIRNSEYADADDKKRARAIIRAYAARVHPAAPK